MPHQVFTLNEVAEYLGISTREVERLVRSGEIPVERSGDRLVFRKREIAAWASQRVLGFDAKDLKAFHATSSAEDWKAEDRNTILPELLKPGYVEAALQARTRAAVVREMVRLAESTEQVNYPKDLLDGVLAREALCSTAIAGGFALLHPRHHEPYMFEASFVVFGRAIRPLPFGADDGGTTDLFCLIACGEDRLHLHALARLSTILGDPEVREGVREADTALDIHRVLLDAEGSLPAARP